jgi:uncharacterized protein YndB with AHSA1/START domain
MHLILFTCQSTIDKMSLSTGVHMLNSSSLNISASGENKIVVSRHFSVPRNMVFDALTQPELLKGWYSGPEGWSLDVCDVDARVGGSYQWVWRNKAGQEMSARGLFIEVVRPVKLMQTVEGEAEITTTLEDVKNETKMGVILIYESRADRDAVLNSEWIQAQADAYDRLEEMLGSTV